MYEAHFGLKSRPFGSKAEGAGVFVGPQQATIMTSLNKGLAAQDAVVTVTGPVGVGKTTIVSRALEQISPGRMVAWVGRMQLAPDEVLELLLTGFGIQRQAKGTIQRFAAFRRLLAERAAVGAQVAIVVEDAHRIGTDALVELEALTAADTGDGTSANIILMGQPKLTKMLATPDLARMNQRTRLRQKIEPFSQAEVTGYLKHAIRAAGGEFDKIFEPGVDEVVYGCSAGIPRMINTLCESALTAAATAGASRVTAALMHQVAVDAFGYEGPAPESSAATAEEASEEPEAAAEKTVDEPETATDSDEPPGDEEAPASKAKDEDPTPDNELPELPDDLAPALSESASEESRDIADAPVASEPKAEESDIDWESPPATEPASGAIPERTAEELNEDDLPPAARNIVVESGRYPELPEIPPDSPLAETAKAANEETEDADTGDNRTEASDAEENETEAADAGNHETDESGAENDGVPDLINDTQPELSTLRPAPAEEPETDEIYENTGSTAIQKKPVGIEFAVQPESPSAETDEPKAEPDVAAAEKTSDGEGDFDLNEALTIDPGSTNVMEGITPNLDSMASEQEAAREPEPVAPPEVDDLPMLSESMRIDVNKESKKASPKDESAEDAAPEPAAETSMEEPAAEVSEEEPVAETPKEKPPAPVSEEKPVSETNNEEPTAATNEEEPAAVTDSETAEASVTPPEPVAEIAESAENAEASEPASEELPDLAVEDIPELVLEPEEPPEPAPKVSEMTARLEAIDPNNRTNDVDALEAALDAAKSGALDDLMAAPELPSVAQDADAEPQAETPEAPEAAEAPAAVPEITLDDKLQTRKQTQEEIEKHAVDIARANSLEEFSDAMAETLFGCEEFDAIAAAVVANPPEEQAQADLPDDYETAEAPPAGPSPVQLDDAELAIATKEEPELATADAVAAASPELGGRKLNESQALRMQMLQDMKKKVGDGPAVQVEMANEPEEETPVPKGPQPDAIEDQIDTAMTASLEALDISKVADDAAEDKAEKKEKKSGGLFSRFRKSS